MNLKIFLLEVASLIAYVLIKLEVGMKTVTVTKASSNLYKLIEEASNNREPIQITGKRTNAILISEEDWRSVQETLFLLSIPGMQKSIREGIKTPLKEYSEKLEW